MKKAGAYLFYGGAIVFAFALLYASFGVGKKADSNSKQASVHGEKAEAVESQKSKPAEKVQVFVFHSTLRCYSCVTAGEFAKKTLEQKFPDELESGKIEFREINVDLPENKEVAAKFKAAGTSFFINAIIDGKDNIKEEVKVWQLISNEQAFREYLANNLEQLL